MPGRVPLESGESLPQSALGRPFPRLDWDATSPIMIRDFAGSFGTAITASVGGASLK